jgi:hypothetical protein
MSSQFLNSQIAHLDPDLSLMAPGTLSAPARLLQQNSHAARSAEKLRNAALASQISAEGRSAKEGCLGCTQQLTSSAIATEGNLQQSISCEQPATILDDEWIENSVG